MWSLLACVLCSLVAVSADELVVRTTQGQLRGSVMKTVEGKDIFAFRGVPFAKAPVGDLRFRAPQPAEPWEGVRNATEDGAPCPQISENFGVPSEDCLTLNVYTTKIPKTKGDQLRPVIIFFHPGGYFSLTGNSVFAGPQYIMDQDIVLVSSNYRLGALGFLSMQDANLPGNYGMKDQVQVLRWVKNNIAAFGGDPNSVTIFGYSAGSRSVFLHMMSPMSKGLFHRCIAMSASPIKPSDGRSPVELAKKLADLVNCPSTSSKQIVDCLRQKSAEEIYTTLRKFREFGYNPITVFRPEVEPDLGDGSERFLIGDPHELAVAGKFVHVPLITGYTTLEFGWKALQIIGNSSLAKEMTDDFERVGPIVFGYERGTEKSHQISRELRKFYLKDQPITNASEQALGQLYSDSIINFPEDRSVKLISRKSSAPVYFYKFSYAGRWSYIYHPPGSKKPYGVVHHDDLIYLFHNSALHPFITPRDAEYQTMKKLTKIWADFARGGDPTPEASPLLNNVKWEPFTEKNLKYLDIGSALDMKRGLYQDRIAVWEKLFLIPGPAAVKNE
ncbi:juvenile hormone esterase [Anabrus simplex]|uniref:juvenile hormone esterase n=1 Tax=Anabrus simplex TaxID=316456 RepID=UPI0035A367B0